MIFIAPNCVVAACQSTGLGWGSGYMYRIYTYNVLFYFIFWANTVSRTIS